MSDTPDSAPPPVVDDLGHARSQFERLQGIQSRTRIIIVVLSIGIIIEMGIFLAAGWASLKRNYTPEAIQAAMAPVVKNLERPVEAKVRTIAMNVAPVYRDLGRKRLEAIMPELKEKAVQELESMPVELQAETEKRLRQSLNRVGRRVQDELANEFPALAEGHDLYELMVAFQLQVTDQTDEIRDYVDRLFQREQDEITDLLMAFQLPDPASVDQGALERRAVHLLLEWLDESLMDIMSNVDAGA